MIKVAKVTICGTWCIMKSEGLQSFIDNEADDNIMDVETFYMPEDVFNALPEFEGF